jgi:hypothetical protein
LDGSGLRFRNTEGEKSVIFETEDGGWQGENRPSLIGLDARFSAQWTEEARHQAESTGGVRGAEMIHSFEDDLERFLFPQGNPLSSLECLGLRIHGPVDAPRHVPLRYLFEVAPCESDEVTFTLQSFSSLLDDQPVAIATWGAEFLNDYDAVPGLRRKMLPSRFLIRYKGSEDGSGKFNRIRLSPHSRCFAMLLYGRGIGGNPDQCGALLCMYYLPKLKPIEPNTPIACQPLRGIDGRRTLLRTVLLEKLRAFYNVYSPDDFDDLRNTLSPIFPSLMPPTLPTRHEIPRGTTPGIRHIAHFSNVDIPVRQSWLYQTSGRPFLEAVYVHSYTQFNPYGSALLANLLWDVKEKSEALERRCLKFFNTDALPPELQDFLFDPNAPFSKLRFQINVQRYMPGWKRVKNVDVPDPIQLLRPHYAVANMPCLERSGEGGRGFCTAIVGGGFATRLYGAEFQDAPDGGNPYFKGHLPQGFCLKPVSTHEGAWWNEGLKKSFPAGYWLASPDRCQIVGTDIHRISRSFYSVVMGKCMQYCDDYKEVKDRPWDSGNTAIVTLHVVLTEHDEDIIRHYSDGSQSLSLSRIAKECHDAWEETHKADNPKPKNPFTEFHDLLRPDFYTPPVARTGPRHVDTGANASIPSAAGGAPAARRGPPTVTITPVVSPTT